ncbi:ribosome maturation factor RimM [Flavilitoribacter nigricans]|uniref:Ribosome maturation factor RimM n=1 Tax=Flavilitoribacter nigricans (strain ATCC 23147 / DSM 23189 / NBRC 102662 / NCIMB 1420 / SS-2) TaxID=1122177 RepID=A0A2D0NDP6_FLAN2|nr:16S rRNA processing protein RimM [Flavilitoribacter nigricans]PHN06605.1 16S rRNA processing protein RimM [Flavilitoribacter nigricans DSM 23189 = NBRC 102662]
MSIELVPIGKTNKTHGVDGTLRITIEDAFLDDFVDAEVVFLEAGGQPTPFFVEDRWGGDPLYLKLEEVDSREDARPLTNKVLSLRREDISVPEEEQTAVKDSSGFAKWIGYTLSDEALGDIGKIEEVIELPQQFLAGLTYKEQEIMIPLHPDLIVKVAHKEKKVIMNLPEGLLEL